MGEVVLTNVFEDMKIEASKSSEVSLFARFRKHYQMIPQTLIRQLDMTGFSAEGELLAEELRVVTLLQVSQDHDFRRDDYKELIELCVLFLNGNVRKEIIFKKPGAMHKARWMAKLLYAIRYICLRNKLALYPKGQSRLNSKCPKFVRS